MALRSTGASLLAPARVLLRPTPARCLLPAPSFGVRSFHFSPSLLQQRLAPRHDLPLTFFSSRTPPFPKPRPTLSSSAFFTSFQRPLSTASIPLSSSTHTSEPTAETTPSPSIPTPLVSRYLFLIAGMVFAIVIVGGMTRLTESGLSITEWNVVSGTIPPLTDQEWQVEFDKYKQSPEYRLQNSHITLQEFKRIFHWEYSHRLLGRLIGLAFLLPIPYFLMRRHLTPSQSLKLLSLGTLIGAQGALGWYMVKSGLDDKSINELGGVARVSQYRLAAHLGLAFAVYVGCLRWGLGMGRDWRLAVKGLGVGGVKSVGESLRVLDGRTAGRVRLLVTALTALVFLTALSGAFVAGLDAGLIYNEFPYMGESIVPPATELFDSAFARGDKRQWWRNFFENPTTAQFDHRVLAMTTFTSIVSLYFYVRRPTIRPHLPPATLRLLTGTLHMSVLQVLLGISTLLYLVPTHLAATHQAGSLVLLSLVVASGASLRRPGRAVRQLLAAGRRV